jgi:hypothetical protein
MKRFENRADLRHDRFVGSDADCGSQRTSQRAKRAIGHSEPWRAEQLRMSWCVGGVG